MTDKVGVFTWRISVQKPGTTAEIDIRSERVGMAEFHRDPFWAERAFGEELKALRRAGVSALDVLLDSTGGSVAYANGIAGALGSWKGPKRLLIDGRCLSAATLILCIPKWDDAAITYRSMVMIHKPRTEIFAKDRTGLWRWIGEKQKERTVKIFRDIYMGRTGVDRATAEGWLASGKTFRADQAVAVGLCDRLAGRAEWLKER